MIVFRVDGNKDIGLGHVMRCLSIADSFRKNKKECVFVMADNSVEELIETRGYKVVVLNTCYESPELEIDSIEDTICPLSPELLIVDSYYVTYEYLKYLNKLAKVVYIDDLAAFPYPVKALINYNVFGPDMDYGLLYRDAVIKPDKLFLGIKYVPLRDEFSDVNIRSQKEKVKDIFVSTGGADSLHIGFKLVDYLCKQSPKYNYHFVIGAVNEDYEAINKIACNRSDIVIHRNVKNMKELMLSCDMAVSAAGSTLYELCSCAIPTITYILADNQQRGAKAFEQLGLMKNVGDARLIEDFSEVIVNEIETLACNLQLRKKMFANMQELVDGNGANRLAGELALLI